MAQRIEVDGMGILEFPDGMSDAEMAAAIDQAMQDQPELMMQAPSGPPNLPPPSARPPVEAWAPPGMALDPATGQIRDTRAEAQALRREGGFLQGASDWAGQIVSGLPFIGTYLDEGAGVAGAAFGQGQDLTQERARAQLDTYREENPKTALGLQVAGAIGGGVPLAMGAAPLLAHAPASLGGQALLGSGIGAVAGASEGLVAGYGRGTDDASRVSEAISGGAVGGALGFGLGGALPILGAGARSAGGYVLDRLAPVTPNSLGLSRDAATILNRSFEADGSFTGAGATRLAKAGPDAMLADAGPNARTLLDTSIQRSGRAGVAARDAVQERAALANTQINSSLDSILGAPQGVQATERGIRQGSAAARSSAYDRAYETPIDYAAPAARDVEDLVSRVPGDVIRQANRLMGLEGQSSRQILPEIADDGTVTYRTMPDVRQLDYITRALNQAAESGDGAGALGGQTQLGRAYQNLSRDIRQNVRTLVPEYGAALDTAAEPIAARQALRFGSELLSRGTTRDDVAQTVAGFSQAERQQAMQGLRSNIDDMLANVQRAVTDGNMEAREAIRAVRELSSRANREKVTSLLGGDASERLFADLDRATVALDLRASVSDNSRTFARQSMDEVIRSQQQGGPVAAVMDGRPINATQRILQALTGRTPDAMNARADAVYEEIANILTQTRGPQADRVLAALQNINQAQPANAETARRIARGGALTIATPTYATGTRY